MFVDLYMFISWLALWGPLISSSKKTLFWLYIIKMWFEIQSIVNSSSQIFNFFHKYNIVELRKKQEYLPTISKFIRLNNGIVYHIYDLWNNKSTYINSNHWTSIGILLMTRVKQVLVSRALYSGRHLAVSSAVRSCWLRLHRQNQHFYE